MAAGPAGFRELIGLNLTAEQREKIQALLEENREVQQQEAEAAREEMNAIGKELDALMDADVYDEAAAQQLFARRSALTNERQILRQKLQHQIVHEILTPEQREALANRQANTAAFGRGRGAGFGPGRGAGFGPGEGFGDGFGPGGGFGPGAGGGGMMLRDGSCIED